MRSNTAVLFAVSPLAWFAVSTIGCNNGFPAKQFDASSVASPTKDAATGTDAEMEADAAQLGDGGLVATDGGSPDGRAVVFTWADGEDGTLTDFSPVGNVRYKNLLTQAQSSPGMDGRTSGWNHGTTSTAILSASAKPSMRLNYEGQHSLEVDCSGKDYVCAANTAKELITLGPNQPFTMQVKIRGAKGTVLRFAMLESSGAEIARIEKTLSGGGYQSGHEWDSFELSSTTLSTTSQVYIQVHTREIVETTFYVDQVMVETGAIVHRWIPGRTSADTVVLTNKTSKGQQIRAAFLTRSEKNTLAADPGMLKLLQERGLTDVFYQDEFLADYATFKDNVGFILQNMKDLNLNLRLHATVPPFEELTDGGPEARPADPRDPAYRKRFTDQVAIMFREFPDLTGLSLDDYLYPDAIWLERKAAGGQIDAGLTPDEQMAADLVDFARAVRDAVHAAKPTAKFSINMYPVTTHSAVLKEIAPYCDYIMPELYRTAADDGVESHAWFKNKLEQNLTDANGVPVIADIITTNYIDWAYTTTDIMKDVMIALDENTVGYSLCQWGFSPSDLYWPDGKPEAGSHSVLAQLGGYVEGEGIKIHVPGMTTDRRWTGVINVKAPKGFDAGVPVYYNLNLGTDPPGGADGGFAGVTFQGTGNWQQVAITKQPNESYVYITRQLPPTFPTDSIFFVDGFEFSEAK